MFTFHLVWFLVSNLLVISCLVVQLFSCSVVQLFSCSVVQLFGLFWFVLVSYARAQLEAAKIVFFPRHPTLIVFFLSKKQASRRNPARFWGVGCVLGECLGIQGFNCLLGLFLGFAAGVPEIHNLYYILVNPVDNLVQSVHDNTSVWNWCVCKKRLYRSKIRVSRKKSFRTIGFFEEFRAVF